MKVFVLGSTGVVGKQLLPILIEKKDNVFALVHSKKRIKEVEDTGAKAVMADVLNKKELIETVKKIEPEVIIHQLTALGTSTGNFKKFDKDFEMTNRFRTEVTDTLLEAAKLAGTKKFIAQSFCGWPFERVGGSIKTEDDPLDPNPPSSFSQTLTAIKYLENAILKEKEVEAIALRYGIFYGPYTGISKDGIIVNLIRKRRLPIVGNGAGIWSFTHTKDAAVSTVDAITNGIPGIYNVVDDEPAPVSTWLPFLAEVIGAKPPRKIPVWLASPLIGEGGVSMMTKIRGASNEKAKSNLGWQPIYPSWRDGFKYGLG